MSTSKFLPWRILPILIALFLWMAILGTVRNSVGQQDFVRLENDNRELEQVHLSIQRRRAR